MLTDFSKLKSSSWWPFIFFGLGFECIPNKHSFPTSEVWYSCVPPVKFDSFASRLINFTYYVDGKENLGDFRAQNAYLPYLPFIKLLDSDMVLNICTAQSGSRAHLFNALVTSWFCCRWSLAVRVQVRRIWNRQLTQARRISNHQPKPVLQLLHQM